MGKPQRRFDVWMSKEMAEQFDEVAGLSGRSRAEVFRRSLALYKILKELELNQGRILLEEPGRPVRELVGL